MGPIVGLAEASAITPDAVVLMVSMKTLTFELRIAPITADSASVKTPVASPEISSRATGHADGRSGQRLPRRSHDPDRDDPARRPTNASAQESFDWRTPATAISPDGRRLAGDSRDRRS
jgi:hypothetical protein